MESWFIDIIISAILAWITSFMWKIFAEKSHDSLISTWYSMIYSSLFSFIFLLFSTWKLNWLNLIFLLSLWNWVFYMVSLATRTRALKYIDSTIYFPIYKISSWIMVALIWLFLFWESLSVWEIIWIILWLLVPLLLIDKREHNIQINLRFWLLLALIWAITTSISIIMTKTLSENSLNIFAYSGISYLIWWVLALSLWKENYKNAFKISSNKIKRYSIINWLFIFWSLYFFIKWISWNLAIAYTINSFSILIPIILSFIFYKEELNFRKILVIITSIVSTLLFKLF